MAAKKTTKRAKRVPEFHAHVLRVSLLGPDPEIWRRVLVRSELDFGTLHDVLQAAMGWQNSHLHQFRVREQRISDPEFELDGFVPEDVVWNERVVTLEESLPKAGEVFEYEYDFGDDWRHRITVEEIRTVAVHLPIVWCFDGAGACPPRRLRWSARTRPCEERDSRS